MVSSDDFVRDTDGHTRPGTLPAWMDQLTDAGFDRDTFNHRCPGSEAGRTSSTSFVLECLVEPMFAGLAGQLHGAEFARRCQLFPRCVHGETEALGSAQSLVDT